jgi:hypothetical protein
MVKRIMTAFEEWQTKILLQMNNEDRKLFARNGLGGYLFWFDNGVPMTQYFEVNPVVSNGKITFNRPIGKQPMDGRCTSSRRRPSSQSHGRSGNDKKTHND